MPEVDTMNPLWVRLFDGLDYSTAMLKARKIQRDEKGLRAYGAGNFADVEVRLSFDGPGRKEYAVWVRPLTRGVK